MDQFASFRADGACDQDNVYDEVPRRFPEAAVNPLLRSSTVPSGTAGIAPLRRGHHLPVVPKHDRGLSRKPRATIGEHWSDRHQRLQARERSGLRSCTDYRPKTEVAAAADMLNRILELERPEYIRLVQRRMLAGVPRSPARLCNKVPFSGDT